MRKLLTVISMAIILLIPRFSFAAETDDYINLKAGWFWPNSSSNGLKDFKQALVYEIDYGRNFGRNFSAELGGTYYDTKNKDTSDYTATFYGTFATIKGKIHPAPKMELFLGGGVGYYWGKLEYSSTKTSGTGIGWHAILGAGYRIIDCLALGVEGKYSQAKLKSNDWDKNVDFGGTSASLYLKYMF
jgi:hypothetical protein